MKSFKVLAIAASIALTASAIGVTGPARAQDKVLKIVSHSPLSVKSIQLGTAIRNGTELAIKQLGKPITDLGYTLEFGAEDDQGNADVGVANAKRFVGDADIVGVIGHLNSSIALRTSPIYNDEGAGLVMISPANTNVNITDAGLPNVNRVCGRDDQQGAAGANYAMNELGAKNIYILHDKTDYGEGVARSFLATIQAAGLTEAGFEGFENTLQDFTAVVSNIAALNPQPDLIYFGGLYDQAQLFAEIRKQGLTSQLMGPDGMDAPDLAKNAGDAVVGLVYTTTAGPASLFPDAKQFVADYKAEYGIDPAPYAAEAYASTQILLNGIETAIKAKNGERPTRAEVAAAVRGTKDFATIIGTITFDAHGDRTVASYYILKVGSADPEKWGENEIVFTTTAPSPLASMGEATPEATPAQ